jgi:hypothetical protein
LEQNKGCELIWDIVAISVPNKRPLCAKKWFFFVCGAFIVLEIIIFVFDAVYF